MFAQSTDSLQANMLAEALIETIVFKASELNLAALVFSNRTKHILISDYFSAMQAG